jgi:hypothetical protein
MNPNEQQMKAAIKFIQASLRLIAEGKNEDVIRQNFTSYLRPIFPDIPSWLERHIKGGEAAVKFAKGGKTRTGFVDNLVDLTAIEYESNLNNQAKFDTGYGQVKDYCSSLLNQGFDPELIIGVLSDTVRWRAYRIESVTQPTTGKFGRDNIELAEIEKIDLSSGDEVAAKTLIDFLNRNLGRLGSRPLSAESIAKDLGFESKFCAQHIVALRAIVAAATEARPAYAELIATLWGRFVNYVGDRRTAAAFDQGTYADELYILTLAKLAIANVIERKALLSDDAELRTILQGEFFRSRGLVNLVEYDYFGWLNEGISLESLLPVARALQDDLRAYDFSSILSEDIFGQLMAQLARRSQRLLLGQEWTPNWLARLIVNHVLWKLPEGESPQLVDMCCGSGAMIVEAVKITRDRVEATVAGESQETKIQLLTQAITGFDIDPLAVMLSKVSWVLAARDLLEPFGDHIVTIPVYHADSLFAITPLSDVVEDEHGQEFYRLRIADAEVQLPRFLISPEFQPAFDSMLDFGYEVAISAGAAALELDDTLLDGAIDGALGKVAIEVEEGQREATKVFLRDLTLTVNRLTREGRNGIWVFILRNSYRPGLVAGQFNGLVSNPPWLALSKIADNPYQSVLRRKAEQFGIRPPGPSFLHIEMATIFLLHATDRYLKDGAAVGCITPDSVLNGYHHSPFRTAEYVNANVPVSFALDEIWRVQENTFKNKAIVLFGRKDEQPAEETNLIPGAYAQETSVTALTFYRNVQGRRTAWSEQNLDTDAAGFFDPANFRQGVDVMPRTLFLHDLTPAAPVGGRPQWRVNPIDLGSSPVAFAIKDAKKCVDFRLRPCVLPDDIFFDVLTSNLLTSFEIVRPLKALLPIRKDARRIWEPLNSASIAAKGAAVVSAFRQMYEGLGETCLEAIWELIDTRSKLTQQVIERGGYLIFTGTSGGIVCSAFSETDSFDLDKLIVDQTLNWARVESEDEAVYLTGLFNSEAINEVIQDFQPEGAFGKRHIHSLPFGITPPYDETQAAHQLVVEQTKRLLAEYEVSKTNDPELRAMLDPNRSTLARRRKVIKNKLKMLPSYGDYANACRVLYGV